MVINRRPDLRAALALAAATGIALAASAGPAAAFSKKVEKACKADYAKLCPSYKPDSPQLRSCMEAKVSEISPGCIQALLDSGEVDKKKVVKK
jgi:hypothetical protein